jgi:hypothetical protein
MRRIEVDRVVALRACTAVPPSACPPTTTASSAVDASLQVRGMRHVWAAGDGLAFPREFGGLAAAQADAAAQAIAALAGADVTPEPFRPVLRGRLLTAAASASCTTSPAGGGGGATVADHALWWPPGKVAGRRLAPYLAERDGTAAGAPAPREPGVAVQVDLTRSSPRRRRDPSSQGPSPMFKTIVVGVDGRDGGRDALALAGRLALLAGGDCSPCACCRSTTTPRAPALRPTPRSPSTTPGARSGPTSSAPASRRASRSSATRRRRARCTASPSASTPT